MSCFAVTIILDHMAGDLHNYVDVDLITTSAFSHTCRSHSLQPCRPHGLPTCKATTRGTLYSARSFYASRPTYRIHSAQMAEDPLLYDKRDLITLRADAYTGTTRLHDQSCPHARWE